MIAPHRRLIPVALAALALAGCGDDGGGGGGGGGDGRSPQQIVDAGDPAKGKEVFAQNCAACHGSDGGGGSGPQLAGQDAFTDAEVVVDQIQNGGGGMPPFGDRLSEQELSDVAAYVTKELAAK
jgi:mono/diheme cytochrome c family protein